MIPSFLLGANPSKRRYGDTWLIFLFALAIAWGLGTSLPVLKTFAVAYPGFPAGVGIFWTVVLLKRYAPKRGDYRSCRSKEATLRNSVGLIRPIC